MSNGMKSDLIKTSAYIAAISSAISCQVKSPNSLATTVSNKLGMESK